MKERYEWAEPEQDGIFDNETGKTLDALELIREQDKELRRQLNIPKLIQVPISKEEIERLGLLSGQGPVFMSIDTNKSTIEFVDVNKKAIEQLEKVYEVVEFYSSEVNKVGGYIDALDIKKYINDKIKELKGE